MIKSFDGGEFDAYLALPASGYGPGIVVLQEIFGVNDYMRSVADWTGWRQPQPCWASATSRWSMPGSRTTAEGLPGNPSMWQPQGHLGPYQ